MQLLIELSGEHLSLPQAELLACLEASLANYKLLTTNQRILVAEIGDRGTNKIKKLSKRLALSFSISRLLKKVSLTSKQALSSILKAAKGICLPSGSFRVKARIIDKESFEKKTNELEREIGKVWADREVNLTNPTNELRIVIYKSVAYLALKITSIDRSQFERRRVQFRPYFSPISIHPRIARALVNLTQIKKRERLLDPFCGTGGFLIEGGLIGARVFGSDIQAKMAEGCKRNLEWYGIHQYKIECKDIGEINYRNMDAVATDFPYGRASKSVGAKLFLYKRAFQSIEQTLKKGGIAVTGLPDKDSVELGKQYLKLVGVHPYYVHRSLTRYFAVWKKVELS
jgi:tRNA (guanine10-N2)-dimethyltransferase